MKNKAYYIIGIAAVGIAFVAMEKPKPVTPEISRQQKEITEAHQVNKPPMYVTPSRSLVGNYLSARFAVGSDDLKSASVYYDRAIEAASTPEDQNFLYERTLPAMIGAGNFDSALRIANKMDISKPTATAQLAVLLRIVEGFKKDDIAAVQKDLPNLRSDGFGRLLKPLIEAWAFAGEGKYDQAVATLNKLAKDYNSLEPLVQMHLAFIYDMQGKNKLAENYYTKAVGNLVSLRSAYIVGQFYERQEKVHKVKDIYLILAQKMPNVPLPARVLQRLDAGRLNKEPFIGKARDGLAAALYDVATVLHQESSSRLAILYAQMAHYLVPQDEFVSLLMGDIFASTNVPQQSISYFQSVPEDNDLYPLSRLRLAQIYEGLGQYKKSVGILEALEKDPLTSRQASTELADVYRRKEDFAKAIPYYTRVIDGIGKPVGNDWVLFYARGMCYERTGAWDKAEADLLMALKLSPQQPEVLNYLAYSWADHGKNLTEALNMLQEALAGAPDDPYITDSVGWALYKNGRVEEAVPFLEAAVQQLPDDAVINDHLGDIYWAANRKLEAQFQWERALKNTKETDQNLKQALEKKLKDGLPPVAAQNTAPPDMMLKPIEKTEKN